MNLTMKIDYVFQILLRNFQSHFRISIKVGLVDEGPVFFNAGVTENKYSPRICYLSQLVSRDVQYRMFKINQNNKCKPVLALLSGS